mgnify:FL=1
MSLAVLPTPRLPGRAFGVPHSAQVQAAALPAPAIQAGEAAQPPVAAGAVESAPAGRAPSYQGPRAGFRKRVASRARGVEGIVSSEAIGERFGKLGRLFDSNDPSPRSQAPVPAGTVKAAAPGWGELLWEQLRDNADPSSLFGPIRDAIKERPNDRQTGYALQYLYFFPLDMALPVLKEHLDGPFRRQVLMALKSYAVLQTNPAQRRWADLHIYGAIEGMLPFNHPLVAPEVEAAILKVFKGVGREQQAPFFVGDERTYAMDLMAVIPSRAFAEAAHQYLDENWLDAEWLYEGIDADGGRIPSNPFSWFQGALDIAASQADTGDAAFLAELGLKLKGRAEDIRKAREERYESLAKAGKLYWGWYKPYDRRLESLARVHAAVLKAVKTLPRAPRTGHDGASFTPVWTVVPAWFDASGLSFVVLRMGRDLNPTALLRRGPYELLVSLDAIGSAKASFRKNSLVLTRKDVDLLGQASRRTVAGILRAAQAAGPVSGDKKAVLDTMLAMLEG